jgi:hypothetical protein
MTHSVFLARIYNEGTSEVAAGLDLFEVVDGVDLKDALEDACKEFFNTPEGKAAIKAVRGSFSWGDLVEHVPAKILAKYGIKALVLPPGRVEVVHNDWPVMPVEQGRIIDGSRGEADTASG